MDRQETKLISGYEMTPIIRTDSILKVTAFLSDSAKVGDIVCLSSGFRRGTACRIIKIDPMSEESRFHVREDGREEVQEIAAVQIAYTVLGVAGRSFSFDVDSAAGKVASHIALSDSLSAKVTRRGLGLAARLAKRFNSESPF